jgi:hypothetical protein
MSCPGSASVDQLQQRGRSIGLTEEETNGICKRHATQALQQTLETLVDDQRWSPDEEQQLAILAEQYGITPTFDASTQEMLDRFRLYWNIEEGVLPEIPVDIHLQRGEAAHFSAVVDWYEFRTQTKRINYGGPTARIKIAKGVYYRVGSANVQRVTEEVMQRIDSGAMYVTNKRIIFIGGKKNTNVRLNKILDFNVYQNGIEIVKDAGRNPFLAMDQNVDICGLVINRLLRSQ